MSHVFSLENDVTRQKLECFILRPTTYGKKHCNFYKRVTIFILGQR